jgi:HEAT repeat protein
MSYSTEARTEEARSDSRTNEQLIGAAFAYESEPHVDDPYSFNDALATLQFRATRAVFEDALILLGSDDPARRTLGADILGQLGIPERAYPKESLAVLLPMLETEQDIGVLQSIAISLGHIHDTDAIPHLIRLKNHPSEDVRYGVVSGLTGYRVSEAIDALIELSDDSDSDVRDWATFGLGSMLTDYETGEQLDTPEIRAELLARVDDADRDARAEALMGLAYRRDERVVEPLARELLSDDVGGLTAEAAEELGSPRFCPALLKLWAEREVNQEAFNERVRRALTACGCEIPET